MGDFASLVKCFRKIAEDTIQAGKPSGVYFGQVTSTSPLEITIDAKHVLTAEFLALTRNVTDHNIDMTVNHLTEIEDEHIHAVVDTYTGGGTSRPTTHLHEYRGRKTFRVHNGLVVGDKVILIREQGGQRHIVIDRIEVMN